jgi:tRNA(fMet)-specific endonuclease VapC
MSFLLDTDTISLAQHGHATVLARMATHMDIEIQLSVVSIQEQMRGWLGRFGKLTTPSQLADWYDRFVQRIFPVWKRFVVLPFSEPAILRFESLRSLRLNIGSMDLRIAAAALEYGLTVVTRNRVDFARVPGLASEDWSV